MPIERVSRWAVVVIAAVALGAALDYGESVFAPLTFGIVLGIVMSPISDFVDRIGLPRGLAALLSITIALGLIASLVLLIEPKVSRAMLRMPEIMTELRGIIDGFRDVFSGLNDVSEEVSEAINQNEGVLAPVQGESDDSVRVPGAFEALSFAPGLVAQTLIIVGVFFFFLLSRHEIYEWVARRRDGRSDGPTAASLKEAERQVSRYFLTISLINGGFGVLIGVTFHAIGMPAPYVWGIVAALMNFILYIGPAIVAVSLFIGGALAFDGLMSLAPVAIYVTLNATEGQFVTPTLVGRNMQVNPLLVFLSLCFWLWLWGPIGGIVAIPIVLYVLAIVSGFGVSQTISFGTTATSRPKRSAGVGS